MFEHRLKDARLLVEADLSRRLETDRAVPVRLQAAMRHALIGGGKRFRPFLVLEFCSPFRRRSCGRPVYRQRTRGHPLLQPRPRRLAGDGQRPDPPRSPHGLEGI